jgi:hypothetical protein
MHGAVGPGVLVRVLECGEVGLELSLHTDGLLGSVEALYSVRSSSQRARNELSLGRSVTVGLAVSST